jgi:hypothetical protein
VNIFHNLDDAAKKYGMEGNWYGIISISAMMSTPTYRKNSSGSM